MWGLVVGGWAFHCKSVTGLGQNFVFLKCRSNFHILNTDFFKTYTFAHFYWFTALAFHRFNLVGKSVQKYIFKTNLVFDM